MAFFTSSQWGFFTLEVLGAGELRQWTPHFAGTGQATAFMHGLARERGVGHILATNLIVLAPVLLCVGRWRPPFGSLTLLFALPAAAMAALHRVEPVGVALVGGLAADGMVAWLRPSPAAVGRLRLFAALVPTVLWGAYFLAVALSPGLAWPVDLAVGTVLWTAISGWGLSLLMVPEGTTVAPAPGG